ncbi:hypothetical protein FRC14_003704 [Serendipita sp. 396]|nr:hypothetical protein FRC14_003704 [Serendipita sp. 396]KAG8867288.1 hypothetical protein FRC20_006198 [Serendipita sp. 405]
MLLRVTALWNRSRLVKIVTTGLFFINMAHFIIFAAHGYAKGIIIPMPVVPYTGCRIVLDHRLPLYTIFLVPLLFDTSIVIFTVLKSYPLVVQNLRSLDGGMFRLSSVLFNDGVAYYIAIIISQAISLYAALSVESNPNVAIPMARAAPPIAVTIVAGNRLLLRLRDVMLMREDEDGRMRRVANRGGVRPSTGGTAAVSAGVSVASPTDPSSMGSSSGTGEGGVHLQHPSNANRVQFSNQLATVDYDYHKYLREDLNHASTSSSSKKGGLPGMAGMESRYRHRPSSERSGLDEIAMTNLRDGSGKKPMFSA